MAGNLFISQALLVLVTLNGVISMKHTTHHGVPHMCQAGGESSEEGCLQTPQNPGTGPLMASEFEVKFSLYNGDGRAYFFTYESFEHSKARSEFIPDAPLKVLIHGFLNNGRSEFPVNVRDAYMKRMETFPNETKYNVLVYDWGKGACAAFTTMASFLRPYNNAAENVEEAGKRLGDMLIKLHEMNITNISKKVHLIGHSLGSHVAGHAGRQIYKGLKKLHWRTSALDPAGPFFFPDKMAFGPVDSFASIRRNRVHFLDVYHTSKDYGSERKIGNVDFYINGGKSQESCKIEVATPIFGFKIPVFVFDKILQVCSHNFATEIFAKSIMDKTMKACTGCYSYEEYKSKKCICEDEVIMGEFAEDEKLGGYPITYGTAYLSTPKDSTVGSNYLQLLYKSKFFGLDLLADGLRSLCFFNFLSG